MEIHNTAENLVIKEVNSICDALEAEKKQTWICTCSQCRQDVICYVLNRIEPHYVVSHRGASRVAMETNNQRRADLAALAYEGIRRVGHNQRPYFDHTSSEEDAAYDIPVFHIPIIMGRVFNGLNFSPMADITVELIQNGKLAVMKSNNWQNPYELIAGTNGTFTFLPKPVPTEVTETYRVFEFSIKITTPGFAELTHIFKIPAVSELAGLSFSLSRTYKLPDLFLFPPEEEKNQLAINE
jgi:competence protein ComFB